MDNARLAAIAQQVPEALRRQSVLDSFLQTMHEGMVAKWPSEDDIKAIDQDKHYFWNLYSAYESLYGPIPAAIEYLGKCSEQIADDGFSGMYDNGYGTSDPTRENPRLWERVTEQVDTSLRPLSGEFAKLADTMKKAGKIMDKRYNRVEKTLAEGGDFDDEAEEKEDDAFEKLDDRWNDLDVHDLLGKLVAALSETTIK